MKLKRIVKIKKVKNEKWNWEKKLWKFKELKYEIEKNYEN